MNPLTSSNPRILSYDCEVDDIRVKRSNITEVCVSDDRGLRNSKFAGYISKSQYANYDGPYQKPIPHDKKRYDFKTVAEKLISFVNKGTCEREIKVLMGYNVLGWDAPVLENNFARFGVDTAPLARWKFFDIANVAHGLGFPMGTTQQQLEVALEIKNLPANRHRAVADVKVVKEIWKKMTANIENNRQALKKINEALLQDKAEEIVAKLLKEYDPTLIPSQEALDVIEKIKQIEKSPKKAIVIGYDTETTGLFPHAKEVTHYDTPPRIVQFGAKIFSPFEGAIYQNEYLESFVNPGIPIPAEATAIHGISTEDLAGQPTMTEVWPQFETWVKASNTYKRMLSESQEGEAFEPQIILVGYNNDRFDNPLLMQELLTGGVDLKRKIGKDVIKSWDAMHLMSTWYTGAPKDKRPPSNKLQDHARFLDIPENNAHRALGDVQTLEQVLQRVCYPIDPATLILECVDKGIQFSRPGVGFKEILEEAQFFMTPEEGSALAVKHAVDHYLAKPPEPKKATSFKRRKVEVEIKRPETQEFVFESQSQAGGKIYT